MNKSNRDLDEETRTAFERVFYHVVRSSFDDDIMEMLVTRAVELINSVDCVDCLLESLDNDIEDIVNDANLEGFTDEL